MRLFRAGRYRLVAGVAGALAIGAFAKYRPDRAIHVGSALVSQTLCSARFVSELDPHQAYRSAVLPMGKLGTLEPVLRYRVDTLAKTVTATVAGLFRTQSDYRAGAGCVVWHDEQPPALNVPRVAIPETESESLVETSNERIRAVLDRLFARADLATTAVVVIHGDSIVAERYATGYSPRTRLQGWSVKKSVLNALVGVLVNQGKLSVHERAPVGAWDTLDDQRRAITVDHLLRMTSGLALAETGSGFDPVSRMLFLERDMASFAERARLDAEPGARWQYTTGNSAVLARIIRDLAGGRAEDVIRFADETLFRPVGMSTAVVEVDATGTPAAMYASARDWARFGQLFASDGLVRGERILPEGWVSYSVLPTLGRGYGAGWWLGGPQWRPDWQLPADAFYAAGMMHQKVLVIPSARLVIARFGTTHVADDGFGTLAQEVVRAVAHP